MGDTPRNVKRYRRRPPKTWPAPNQRRSPSHEVMLPSAPCMRAARAIPVGLALALAPCRASAGPSLTALSLGASAVWNGVSVRCSAGPVFRFTSHP